MNDVALIGLGMNFAAILIATLLYVRQYKKVPPNKAMVVYGKTQKRSRKGFMVITGGGKFIQPVLEDFAFLNLEARPLNLALNNVSVDTHNEKAAIALIANSVVRITSDPRLLELAAVNLLKKPDKDINHLAMNIIEGHVRNTCARTSLEEIKTNFPEVSSMISGAANTELNKVGLEMVSFSIIDVQ